MQPQNKKDSSGEKEEREEEEGGGEYRSMGRGRRKRSERILVGGVPQICRQSQASAWLHATLHMEKTQGGGRGGGGGGRGRASLLRV